MTLSRCIIIVFLSFAAMFVIRVVWALYLHQDAFGPVPLLLASLYCVLCTFLVAQSQGLQRTIMLVASMGILLAFVQRILLLSFDDSLFLFPFLPVLSNETITTALGFMTIGTLAFWLGVRLATRGKNWSNPDRFNSNQISSLFRYRTVLGVGGLIIVSLNLLMAMIYGIGLPTEATDQFGFLSRLLPIEAMGFVIMYLLVRYWKNLTIGKKVILVGYFVVNFCYEFLAGQRGSLLHPFLTWLIMMTWIKRDFKFPIKWVLVGIPMIAFGMPAFLSIVLSIRDMIYSGHSFLDLIQSPPSRIQAPTLWETVLMISNRYYGFDALVAIMNHWLMVFDAYMTPLALVKSVVGMLTPDRIWAPQIPSLGLLASVFMGLSWDMRNAGAWFGFGVFYGYLGPLGAIALGGLGAVVGFVLKKWSRGGVFSFFVAPYFLNNFVWMVFVSGNLDQLIARFLSDSILIILLILVINSTGSIKFNRKGGPHPLVMELRLIHKNNKLDPLVKRR